MKCNLYIIADHWILYHVKIPSKSMKNVVYDVVIEFDKTIIEEYGYDRIDNLQFKCWSNCPSFVYTYAKTFYDNGMLIDWLTEKYDKPILQEDSKVRNAYGIISYERSLYSALRFILSGGRNLYSYILAHSIVFHKPDEIKRMILSHDDIMIQYNRSKELAKIEKMKSERRDEEKSKKGKGKNNTIESVKSTNSIKKVGNISTKKISKVGKIKRI